MTMLNDERIAEIGAKLASYGFKDHLGHSLTNCQDFQDLLAEVKALKEQNDWLEKIRWMHNEDAQFMLDEISRVSHEYSCWLKHAQQQAEKKGA